MNRVGPNIAYIKCAVFVRRLANVDLTQLDHNDLSKILLKYLHHVTSGFYPVETGLYKSYMNICEDMAYSRKCLEFQYTHYQFDICIYCIHNT